VFVVPEQRIVSTVVGADTRARDDAGMWIGWTRDHTGQAVAMRPSKRRRRADIRDDPARTLMVVESSTAGINWMEPRDLEWDHMSFRVNDKAQKSISSEHHFGSYPGPHVAAADRALDPANQLVNYLASSTRAAAAKVLLIIDDGESVALHQGPKPE
jgi:hypothetical protein